MNLNSLRNKNHRTPHTIQGSLKALAYSPIRYLAYIFPDRKSLISRFALSTPAIFAVQKHRRRGVAEKWPRSGRRKRVPILSHHLWIVITVLLRIFVWGWVGQDEQLVAAACTLEPQSQRMADVKLR